MNLKIWLHHRLQRKVKRRNEDDNDSDENDPNEILADNDTEDMASSIETDNIFCPFINLQCTYICVNCYS